MTDYNDRAFAKFHVCQVKSRTKGVQIVHIEVAACIRRWTTFGPGR